MGDTPLQSAPTLRLITLKKISYHYVSRLTGSGRSIPAPENLAKDIIRGPLAPPTGRLMLLFIYFLDSLWANLSEKYRFSRGQKSANVTFKLLRAGFCSHFEILSGRH